MFDQKLHDSLPETLRPLVRMAGNLWWSWNGSGMSLFRDIGWKEVGPKYNHVFNGDFEDLP